VDVANTVRQYDYYLKIVLMRKRLFLTVALIIMTIGVILAYTLPKKYEAESTIFIDQNVITDLVKGIAVTPSVEAKIKKLSVSLLSRTMLLKVLGMLDKDLLLHDSGQVDTYIEDLTKRIVINYKEKDGVFKIALRDKDPLFARDFINTLTRKYIDDNTSSKREESLDATKFLADQIETFKKRIDIADEAINRYKSEKGLILSNDDVYLRGEIDNAEKKLEEITIRRTSLEAQKRIIEGQAPTSDQLAEAEANLASLRSRYTDINPKVTAAQAEVSRLRSGKGRKSKGQTKTSIAESPEMLQVQVDALKEMEAHQAHIVQESKEMLRDIPSAKAELAELVRKKENEEVIYRQLVSRYGQSEVSKQMELQDKSITFRVLDPAVTPRIPVSPNRLLIIVISIVAGFGLSFGLIWLLDIIKGGVYSPTDLKGLNLPVFAVIPHMPDPDKDRIRRRQDRILLGVTVGYMMFLLLLGSADILQLSDKAASVETLIHNMISSIRHRN
jgi:polysaccharide chain length determinant protein (PEP-CTERM system associated)